MKCCENCGYLGRPNNLRQAHFPYCQPKLDFDETGFLKVGQLPRDNVEDFRNLLRLIGISEKGQKKRRQEDSDAESSRTESEDSDPELEALESINSKQCMITQGHQISK